MAELWHNRGGAILFYNLHYEKFADGTIKCIEDEIPFELPEGWAWARIASIAEEVFAGGDKPERFSKERNNECQ